MRIVRPSGVTRRVRLNWGLFLLVNAYVSSAGAGDYYGMALGDIIDFDSRLARSSGGEKFDLIATIAGRTGDPLVRAIIVRHIELESRPMLASAVVKRICRAVDDSPAKIAALVDLITIGRDHFLDDAVLNALESSRYTSSGDVWRLISHFHLSGQKWNLHFAARLSYRGKADLSDCARFMICYYYNRDFALGQAARRFVAKYATESMVVLDDIIQRMDCARQRGDDVPAIERELTITYNRARRIRAALVEKLEKR